MSQGITGAYCDDLRQGVTEAEHLVLDRVEAIRNGNGLTVDFLLRQAQRSAAAAVRADPATGNGRRRVERAREAAAMLIAALNQVDESGKAVRS
ncbi:hypothetical protein [Polymorphobacter sp.]|uniref:hypothetical protein n=1 Tax=Polymorphobacter sp. TaxID=1909290 RepID=UPI003F71020A